MWKDFILGDGSKAVKQVDIDGKTVFKKQSYVDTEFTSSLAPTSWTEVTTGTEYTASNDWGEWRITASSYYNIVLINSVDNAFDNNKSSCWRPSIQSTTDYSEIVIALPQGVSISPKTFEIIFGYMYNGSIQGYINGTWEKIISNVDSAIKSYTKTYDVSTDKFYTQFKVQSTSIKNSNWQLIYEFFIVSGTARKAVS